MAPVYSKNAILVGTANYFCLVCEAHLKSERDTDVHISKPVHQKQLEAIQYVDEFESEGIKKIKNKYFCELCNKVLTVPARVRLHVAAQSHADTKYKNSFKRIGNYLTAFDKVAICDQSWNGLSENACAICNIEYEDEEIHKNQSSHILNVVQMQVEIDNDLNVYRKIDELYCHCLTCNTVLALSSLPSHFVGDEHKKLYQACCDAYNKIPLNTHKQPDKTIIKDEATKSETVKKEATKNDPKSIGNDKINYTKVSSPQVNNLNRKTNNVIKENVQKAILNLSKIYLQQMENNKTSSNKKEHAQKYTNVTLEDPDKILDKISGAIGKRILKSKENGSKPNKFRPKTTVAKKTVFSSPVIIKCNHEESNKNDPSNKDDVSNTELLVEVFEAT